MFHAIKMFAEKLELKFLQWNFFSTSHGKGCVDGIGGSAKRIVWQVVRSRNAMVSCADEFAAVLTKKDTNIGVTVMNDPISMFGQMWNALEGVKNVLPACMHFNMLVITEY